MIHVDRSRVARPAVLALDGDTPAAKELGKATSFYAKPRGQQRFSFNAYKSPTVRGALINLFYGKCAYCETKIADTGPVDIEMFRPKSGVVERPEHPGYWWLAMSWENLLIACASCNRGKANRFPLEDERKRAFKPGEERNEKPLLLDPCNDAPEHNLFFDLNGPVYSATRRGQVTIDILRLNRESLVAARASAAQTAMVQIKLLHAVRRKEQQQSVIDTLTRLCEPDEEYAALKRQMIKPELERFARKSKINIAVPQATPTVTVSQKRSAQKAFEKFEQAQSSYSLADEEGRQKYRGRQVRIERIALRDVRAIRKLDLDMASWLMLLGENGTGKSTLLQATALALVGAQMFVDLARKRGVHPSKFIRYGRTSASVSVKLSGFPNPHTLTFREKRVDFVSPTGGKSSIVFDGAEPRIKGSGWDPQMVVLGYGATRLLPHRSNGAASAPIGEGFSRVENLFDPFVPLIDAEAWLLGLGKEFDNVARVLLDLLPLPADAELVPEGDCVLVVAHGARVPLHQLSDGYQSVVAMTVDILERALRVWPNLQEAEGTVLLDEIGAHLHPTWKMRAVGSLRKALPGMQFLATTHDPLCLRGLGKGEVAVMRRGEDSQVFSLTGLPSPGDFRIDQLLTSDFFGLSSTSDPDTEAIFDEYYALLALKNLDAQQSARLSFLRDELKGRRHLGSTLRENLMYDAIDRLVAQHRAQPALPIEQLQQEAVDEVAKIWNEAP